jgi:hypothetical protein
MSSIFDESKLAFLTRRAGVLKAEFYDWTTFFAMSLSAYCSIGLPVLAIKGTIGGGLVGYPLSEYDMPAVLKLVVAHLGRKKCPGTRTAMLSNLKTVLM